MQKLTRPDYRDGFEAFQDVTSRVVSFAGCVWLLSASAGDEVIHSLFR